MTKCIVCGGSEFEVQYGTRVCVECGSQETNFLELEDEETAWEVDGGKYTTFATVQKKPQKTDEEVVSVEQDWTTFEAMNTILMSWTNALTHIGASERLREAVLNLWVIYLKKRKVAFNDDAIDSGLELAEFFAIRDLKALGKADVIQKKITKRKTADHLSEMDSVKKKISRKRMRCSDRMNLTGYLAGELNQTLNATQQNNSLTDENKVDEMFEDEESSLFERSHSIHMKEEITDELDDTSNSLLCEEGVLLEEEAASSTPQFEIGSYKQRIQLGSQKPQCKNDIRLSPTYLTIQKLLAILYLALLLSEEDILLLDLLRWCREGHVPYFTALYLLESRMVDTLKKRDVPIFNQYLPTAQVFQVQAGRMAAFLSIQAIPLPCVRKVVNKLADALNLPAEVKSFIWRATKIFNREAHCYVKIPCVEIFCASCIILVFKLIFGLDGKHENLLSEFAEKTNRIMDKNGKPFRLFSWHKWQRYINNTRWWLSEVDVGHTQPNDRLAKTDSERFAQYFWTQGIFKCLSKNEESTGSWEKGLTQYLLKVENTNFEKLMQQKPLFSEACKMPLRGKVQMYVEEAHRRDPSSVKDIFLKIAKELKETDFSPYTVVGITETKDLENAFKEIDKPITIKLVSLTAKEVFRTVKTIENRQKRTKNEKTPATVLLPDPLENFWVYPHSEYLSSKCPSDVIPSSFLWLVRLLSDICETSECHLLSEYNNIEAMYLRRVAKEAHA